MWKKRKDKSSKKKAKNSFIYPSDEYELLDKDCQTLVEKAEKDSTKQFEIGQCLVEGTQNFPRNTEIAVKYLQSSVDGGCVEAAIYYCRMLIKGDIIEQNLPEAEKILKSYHHLKNLTVVTLFAKICKKQKKYDQSFALLSKCSEKGCSEAMYELGKQIYKGQGCEKDDNEAKKLFENAKNNGIEKSDKYLNLLDQKSADNPELTATLNEGEAESLNKQGIKLRDGIGVEIDKEEAARLFKQAADDGNAQASFNYAQMHDAGDGVPVDHEEAAKYYKIAADQGNKDGMLHIGKMLRSGTGVPPDKEEAARYMKMAADEGVVEAMFEYGSMLSDGEGVSADKVESARYFKMAADEGHVESMCKYGSLLTLGEDVPANGEEASRYFKMATDQGSVDGAIAYCRMLIKGDVIEQNLPEAEKILKSYHHLKNLTVVTLFAKICKKQKKYDQSFALLSKCSEKGCSEAMYELGKQIYKGQGCEKDDNEAKKLFENAKNNGIEKSDKYLNLLSTETTAASNEEDAESLNKQGIKLRDGDGVEVDNEEAKRYFKMAADKGNVQAMYNYGMMLSKEHRNEEAATYVKMAADEGEASALNSYGVMLDTGEGVPFDKEESARYIKMAADQNLPKAMYNYALILDNGDGIPENKEEAAKYYKMAADNGDIDAMYNYAMMLEDGEGVPVDIDEARKYYKMAADKGSVKGMFNLALLLFNKNEIKQSAHYYKLAAENGDADAMNNFAVMLENGYGVSVDMKKAAVYYKMAAEMGQSESMNNFGLMLQSGVVVAVDKNEAARYFKMSAEKGCVEAMFNYGRMLDTGDGIPADKKEAERYIKMAADQGCPDADKYFE